MLVNASSKPRFFRGLSTLRGGALLAVLFYHVLGAHPEYGLHIAADSPVRALGHTLNDVAMPLFAAVSGALFALHPPRRGGYGGFLLRKARRLLVPGAVAVVLYATLIALVKGPEGLPHPLWHIFAFPFLHMWFIQALFGVFVVVGAGWFAFGPRSFLPLFAVACIAVLTMPRVLNVFSVDLAIWLLPYFLLGAVLRQYRELISDNLGLMIKLATIGLAIGLALTVREWLVTGTVAIAPADVQSLCLSLGSVTLLLLTVPHWPPLALLGPPAFSIYLYHVFGTSLARRVLHSFGVEALLPHIVAGVGLGLLTGLAVYQLSRMQLPSGLILRMPSVPSRDLGS